MKNATMTWINYPSGEIGLRDTDWPSGGFLFLPYSNTAQFWQVLIRLAHDNVVKSYIATTGTEVIIPYLPYAREDRPMNPAANGEFENFGLNVIGSLISEIPRVCLVDPHSDCSQVAVKSAKTHIDKESIFECYFNRTLKQLKIELDIAEDTELVFVAPDLGAAKEVEALANIYGCRTVFFHKKRDIDGKIKSVEPLSPVAETDHHTHYLIVDDICDGGGTFFPVVAGLGGTLENDFSLYVTHGLFTKGTFDLHNTFKNLITTDSVVREPDKKLKVLPIVPIWESVNG